MIAGACEVVGITDQTRMAAQRRVAKAAFPIVRKLVINSACPLVARVVRRGTILFYPPGEDKPFI
jgi:hypothetical protein